MIEGFIVTIVCPICEGKGQVPGWYYCPANFPLSDNKPPLVCYTCNGKGEIEVIRKVR